MGIVYVLGIYDCDYCKGYHIIDVFNNKRDAEERKKKLELIDKNIYGFEVNSYFIREYDVI